MPTASRRWRWARACARCSRTGSSASRQARRRSKKSCASRAWVRGVGTYQFRAIDASGRNVDGELSTETRATALAELSSRGLVPIDLRDAPAAANDAGIAAARVAAPKTGRRFAWLEELRRPRFG